LQFACIEYYTSELRLQVPRGISAEFLPRLRRKCHKYGNATTTCAAAMELRAASDEECSTELPLGTF